ncbi:MAG TPA: hypothetical protein VKT82_12235 [Ktedonobacterales bacterium]|nr:hypothetical protein [Ktedonobacterales bacterium]
MARAGKRGKEAHEPEEARPGERVAAQGKTDEKRRAKPMREATQPVCPHPSAFFQPR